MRRFTFSIGVLFGVLLLASLAGTALAADDDDQPVPLGLAFQAIMRGQAEVPPTSSAGRGLATYMMDQDGVTLHYTVMATGLTSTASAAHIHTGGPGVNGPIVVNLCGAGDRPACESNGVVASGDITSADLIGPLAGHPLNDLIALFRVAGAYSNVHTANFPNGEIRGAIIPLGAEGDNGQGDNGNQDDQGGDD
jgi:hypothetical protein